ncbi:uncharacterized protein LOC116200452 [Punica granatum]|uniref:Uncharacterized protein LOC116200452 n=1 Tax=Punica granatum TaxID=22663 RepID=A0A6P8CTK0_PUNGR|nr:uncharacterized protein LOC116200452 [Punica granatum]
MASVGSVRRARGVRNEGRRHGRRDQAIRDGVDRNIGSIKRTIPHFQGRNDLDAFIEWERKVELIFDCHNYSEEKKVKLVAVEFTDYAIIWWDKLVKEKRMNHERPIETWEEMKTSKAGDEEMEIALIRANIEEDEEAIMARFLCSLNREIANVVELQNYVEIEDMVSMAMKVERQLKRGRPAKQKGGSYSGSSNWKSKWGASSISVEKPKSNAEMGMNRSQWDNKERDSGELETEDEESDHMPLHDDSSDCEYAAEGNALVIMQALNAQMKEEERDDVQRENIFHTRCQVKDRVCSLIIDGGSCVNVASKLLVDKLGLRTLKHHRSYNLQWLNESGEVKVNKQVLVSFTIGRYKDEVLCDDDRKVTLVPLTPNQVYEDQFRIKISICEKSEEFGDVFSKELPNRLPPIRGIEHQIDFVPGAVILSRPAYRSNPKEIKELQRQVDELLAQGHVRESMSPYAVPVLLVPKKDGT